MGWGSFLNIWLFSCYPTICWKQTILSLLNCLCTFFENQLSISVSIYFWNLFYPIELFVYAAASTVLSWLLYLYSKSGFQVVWVLQMFFLKLVGYSGSWWILKRACRFLLKKSHAGILIGIVSNLYINFGRIHI